MPIKRIFSAGGIVIREGTKGTNGAEGTKVLVTQHSKHKGWDFPKGHREIYESEEQTAVREVEEETGVKAEIVEKVGQTQYFYYDPTSSLRLRSGLRGARAKGEKVLKTVVYYLMRYVGEGEATTAFEVSDMKWLPLDEVEKQLTFKDTKEMWDMVKPKVKQLTINS
ncbi:NUDIX domain-containing protein [Candidatus Curtissbacteria bacterium]|nr:NUDIX domain-containing protein [Candidatus Curtissbacteria bacterium]